MTAMKDYDAMDAAGQERLLSNALEGFVQRQYYENDMDGLIELGEKLGELLGRVKSCIECLEVLRRGGDVYGTISLLLEYISKDGLSEDFVSGLMEVSERAQEVYAKTNGGAMTADEEQEVMRRLRNIMTRNEVRAICEVRGLGKEANAEAV